MRIAETVTFGGSGLDRAAHLRGRPDEIARLTRDPAARCMPIWRGKPLFEGAAPGWLAMDHPVFADAHEPALFLGLDEAGPRFARDLPLWEPESVPDTLGAFHDPSQQRHPELSGDFWFTELRGAMTLLSAREAEFAAMARALTGWHSTHGFCARCGARSAVAMGGWQRTCPECRAHHFPRTDPVVIMLILRANSVLLGRSPGWPEGMYSLLAGFVEPGETMEAAVRREVFEESGVRVGRVDYLASQPWPFPASLMLGCYGQALTDEIVVDPTELEDARWVTREELAHSFAGLDPGMKPARAGAIAQFLLRNWLADGLDLPAS